MTSEICECGQEKKVHWGDSLYCNIIRIGKKFKPQNHGRVQKGQTSESDVSVMPEGAIPSPAEKSLSEKIKDIKNRILLGYNEGITIERIKQNNPRVRIILEMEEDVKEAVKRSLKRINNKKRKGAERYSMCEYCIGVACSIIEEEMGDNLI